MRRITLSSPQPALVELSRIAQCGKLAPSVTRSYFTSTTQTFTAQCGEAAVGHVPRTSSRRLRSPCSSVLHQHCSHQCALTLCLPLWLLPLLLRPRPPAVTACRCDCCLCLCSCATASLSSLRALAPHNKPRHAFSRYDRPSYDHRGDEEPRERYERDDRPDEMPDSPGMDYYKYMGESRDELREVRVLLSCASLRTCSPHVLTAAAVAVAEMPVQLQTCGVLAPAAASCERACASTYIGLHVTPCGGPGGVCAIVRGRGAHRVCWCRSL